MTSPGATPVARPTLRPGPSRRTLERFLIGLTLAELRPSCKPFHEHPEHDPFQAGALAAVDCWVDSDGLQEFACWLTTSASRPVLVDQLEAALRTGVLVLHDGGAGRPAGRLRLVRRRPPRGPRRLPPRRRHGAGIAWQVRWRSFERVLGAASAG